MQARFCTYCGAPFLSWPHTQNDGYPKKCSSQTCGTLTWKNPEPVAVVLLPVCLRARTGLLIGRRGIEPEKGNWALPGGYIDLKDETWRHAAARELFEETRIVIKPEVIKLFDVRSAPSRKILIFGLALPVGTDVLDLFVPNEETSEVKVIYEPTELAFTTHTETARKFFEQFAAGGVSTP